MSFMASTFFFSLMAVTLNKVLKEEHSATSTLWEVQGNSHFFLSTIYSVFGSRKLILQVMNPEVKMSCIALFS